MTIPKNSQFWISKEKDCSKLEKISTATSKEEIRSA